MPDPRDPRDDRDKTADELAWQAIIDNFGERAELDEPAVEEPAAEEPPTPGTGPFGGRFADATGLGAAAGPAELHPSGFDDEAEGYIPPEPPPLPRLEPDRALAWGGVFGSPLVLLLALLLSIPIPTWLGYLLVCGFVGGFVYLVLKMPREPRDPWDDGAQV